MPSIKLVFNIIIFVILLVTSKVLGQEVLLINQLEEIKFNKSSPRIVKKILGEPDSIAETSRLLNSNYGGFSARTVTKGRSYYFKDYSVKIWFYKKNKISKIRLRSIKIYSHRKEGNTSVFNAEFLTELSDTNMVINNFGNYTERYYNDFDSECEIKLCEITYYYKINDLDFKLRFHPNGDIKYIVISDERY